MTWNLCSQINLSDREEIFHAASCNMKKFHYDLTAVHAERVICTWPGKKGRLPCFCKTFFWSKFYLRIKRKSIWSVPCFSWSEQWGRQLPSITSCLPGRFWSAVEGRAVDRKNIQTQQGHKCFLALWLSSVGLRRAYRGVWQGSRSWVLTG